MKSLYQEIESFLNITTYTIRTYNTHRRNLQDFCSYLSNLKSIPIPEVHLLNIYSLRDAKGNLIRIMPVDYKIIDNYMVTKQDCSYNQLLRLTYSLGSFFRYLDSNYMFPNPMRLITFNIKDMKPNKRPVNTLSRRDVLKFFHTLISTSTFYVRDLTLFSILFGTGCRITEILTLRVRHIDFDYEFITLEKTKNRKTRVVPLRHGMGNVLKWYCEDQVLGINDYLFKNNMGRPMQYNNARKLFKRYLKMADIPENHLHILRHTFATHLFEAGSEMPLIRQLLGQAGEATTFGYVHPNYIRNYGLKNTNNKQLYALLESYLEI
ncbi:tyrosine-type recombinase/integrase [Paenibacillus wynnii]|uniref:tyrosine-type recombinase/integrase n=1 Tax=Paenibacillus wynnii TaxID=268407 RepID=UPI00279144C9|nr:tyrosine-type recombinase/integrase [Paenibacillus wynnii]MDQ0194924.1 site-specific recombinase XerD [Paenibacillus wynnii]